MAMTSETSHQLVVLARLCEFCQWRGALTQSGEDPWSYMRRKLLDVEAPLTAFKGELLRGLREELLAELTRGPVSDARFAQYKDLFERLLSRGDFADVAIHLSSAAGPACRELVGQALSAARAQTLFQEERRPAAQRSPAWNKLVQELWKRLGFDVLERVMERGPESPRRRAYVLRRMRRDVAEYCTVVKIPTAPTDTLSPFMLPRIEAVVAACLRFLSKYR